MPLLSDGSYEACFKVRVTPDMVRDDAVPEIALQISKATYDNIIQMGEKVKAGAIEDRPSVDPEPTIRENEEVIDLNAMLEGL